METLIAGLLIASLVGILVISFSKKSQLAATATEDDNQEGLPEATPNIFTSAINKLSDELLFTMSHAENRSRKQPAQFIIPDGELGVFL
ncbi:MAG: hypothetical protein JWQ27_2208 [Ferruginibacter sp.]|nr:hypothetical protein [Ferruginibacter sp.]